MNASRLYICPECADLGCGAITVAVERGTGTVTWRNWGYQNNYDKGFIAVAGLPDVTFDAAQYGSALREALDWLLRGQTGQQ